MKDHWLFHRFWKKSLRIVILQRKKHSNPKIDISFHWLSSDYTQLYLFLKIFSGRPYLFQVRAFNRVGAGPWSESLEVVSGAGAPDTPNAPRVQCRGPNLAILDWNEPSFNGAMVTEYRLQLAIGKDKRSLKIFLSPFSDWIVYPQWIMFFFHV